MRIIFDVFIGIIILIASTGCSMPKNAIKYSLDDIVPPAHSSFAGSTLVVQPFAEARKPLASECPWDGPAAVKIDGKEFYYNCDRHYKSESVPAEVTNAIVAHIKKSGLFKEVAFAQGQQIDADYILSGTVAKFDGLRETHLGATIAAQFSLLGLPFMFLMSSDYDATTELDGLKLVRTKDGIVVWSGKEIGHILGSEMADPYGWTAYEKANLSLKEATNKVIADLSSVHETAVAVERTETKTALTKAGKTAVEGSH